MNLQLSIARYTRYEKNRLSQLAGHMQAPALRGGLRPNYSSNSPAAAEQREARVRHASAGGADPLESVLRAVRLSGRGEAGGVPRLPEKSASGRVT